VDLSQEDIDKLVEAGYLQEIPWHVAKGWCRSFAVLESAKSRRRWILYPKAFNDVFINLDTRETLRFPTTTDVAHGVRKWRYAALPTFI
jgi:hypothetical protein